MAQRAYPIVAAALWGALLTTPLQGEGAAPPKTAGRGFALMARAIGAITVNRVYCGLYSGGELCVDSSGSSTIGGAFWPRNSPQMYMFNSGMQVAGTIDPAAGFSWAGDTTGAFFFDDKGTTIHGEEVEPIWNYSDPDARAQWPQAAAVPLGDASAALFAPALRGRPSASEGDIWTLAWEGDTARMAGRYHPLGLALETRVLAWNSPQGNNDVIYFLHTFYNISSSCSADYAAIRPGLREELMALGARFRAENQAKFGIQIPACGYALKGLWFGLAYDPDVSSDAGINYASVDIPLNLAYTYQANFRRPDGGYVLPSGLGDPPFINGYGFVGMKFLKTPVVGAQEAGIRLYSNITGGGLFNSPQNASQLFRYLSASISPLKGDGNCNYNPITQHICYVKMDGPADMHGFQSTGPADLPPGGSVTIATAYIFASAVAIPTCPASNCATVPPGSPTRWLHTDSLALGANPIDSMTGFAGYTDLNVDGVVQPSELRAVRGSLLQKAQIAQLIFDNGFIVPAAPDAPNYFLVPGDHQVTIVWRPSATEQTGDAFFNVPNGPGDPASPLYDPDYRQFDVEGYRIYRGRVDDPSRLTLVAQFDHGAHDTEGHTLAMSDYLGVVDPTTGCAPELGRRTVADGCAIDFDATPAPGAPYVAHLDHPIVGPFIQVKLGDRFLRLDSLPYVTAADTAVTGGKSGLQDLWDTGVPFVFVDSGVRNDLRYFYTVTAFDVNSIQSGPSSQESARILKGVTPVHPATNYHALVQSSVGVRGRGVMHDPAAPVPTLDSVTGEFSGRMPAADGATIGLLDSLVSRVVSGSGSFFARLDSLRLGQVDLSTCCISGAPGVATHYYYTLSDGAATTQIDLPISQGVFEYGPAEAGTVFRGIPVDQGYGARYGGDSTFALMARFTAALQTVGYMGGSGMAAGLGAVGFQSYDFSAVGTTGYRYDGFRWYSGANESTADPTSPGTCGTSTQACPASPGITDLNNAGAVSGATLVYMPHSYRNINREWRNVEAVLGGAVRAADIRVYWGAAGAVDSVIDLTHNVPLPWDSARLGAGWAILNTANTGAGSQDGRPGVLTPADWMCIEPFFSELPGAQGFFPCTTQRNVSKSATLGAVAGGAGDNQSTGTSNSWSNPANSNGNGFSMYVAGTITLFGGMAALPAAGTTWTLRSYSGVIFGGKGSTSASANPGPLGPYKFISRPRSLTAVGAEVVFNYSVQQQLAAAATSDLARVHTVPDPYYVTNGYETDPRNKVIKFVNLPTQAIIRIYSLSGVLVRVIEHNSGVFGGSEDWDVLNSGGRLVANGVYFYAIESGEARRVGRMTIVTLGR